MEKLTNKTSKELSNMLETVAKRFFVARTLHRLKSDNTLAEKDYNDDSPYDVYIVRVLSAYDSLTEQEQNLINNEFFYQSYHDWWKPIYPRSSFYKRKKEAMIKFLGAFYRV